MFRITTTAFVAASALTAGASAAVINVPADHATVQDAINAAVDGDEVIVGAGTYNERINLDGKLIILRSADGPAATTLDGTGFAGNVIRCETGETRETVIRGFTIANGNASNIGGGGLRCTGSTPTVMDCVFVGCETLNGMPGGAVYNQDGASPRLLRCSFVDNVSTGVGGAIANLDSSPIISMCRFENNSAALDGGAVHSDLTKGLSIVPITNCHFDGNTTDGFGGAVWSGNDVNTTVGNCLLIENGADSGRGGALYGEFQSAWIIGNITAVGNTSAGGFALDFEDGALVAIANSIVRGNTPDQIGGQGNIGVVYSNVTGGFAGAGNIDMPPLFADGASGDFTLTQFSPCVDAGDTNLVPDGVFIDLKHEGRVIDVLGVPNTGIEGVMELCVDMGAYEFQVCGIESCAGDIDLDGDVDVDDLLIVLANWGLCPTE